MSTKYYDQLLSEGIDEVLDLYQTEFMPYDKVAGDRRKMQAIKKPADWFEFYAMLYIKYLETFRKFEAVYNQVTHPQKKAIFKSMLDSTMLRIMELRKDLVMFNVSSKAVNSDFINFDELLLEQKILPEKLEVPIPNYYKEDTPELLVRDDKIMSYLKEEDRHLPEEEVMEVRLPLEPALETDMHVILVNERGRQGVLRAQAKRALFEQMYRQRKKLEKVDKGDAVEQTKETDPALVLQRYVRAYIDRKEIERLRNEEMEFLGMLPSKPDYSDLPFLKEDPSKFDPEKEIEKIKQKRKTDLRVNENRMTKMVEKVKQEIIKHETPDMRENLMYEMRNWITEYYEQHEGKELPDKIDNFYTRNDVAKPLSKEEEDALRKAKQEKEKAAKKAAADKKKKKKTEAEMFMDAREARGPDNSKALRDLNEIVDKYKEEWFSKETPGDNYEQKPNKDMIIRDVMPEIEESVKEQVNGLIKAELANLHIKLGIAKKKDRTKKPKKPKKPKAKKIPLEKMIKGRAPVDLMGDMTKAGVIKVFHPTKISEFLGDYNLLRTLQESKATSQPDPSMAQLRQICTEHIILPMGDIEKIETPPPANDDIPVKVFKTELHNRTFLFYGPQGTGKSLMVRAIAHETRSMILDISGYNVADRFVEKKRFQQMLVTVFKLAKTFQPAIILMDEVEQYFPGKIKKKGKKKGAGSLAPVIGRCSKFKKDFITQVNKHLEPSDRVSIIGLTNKPYYCNMKDVKKFFYKKFYFPYPDSSTRELLFKHLVEKQGIKLTDSFQLSLFSHMTEGVTPGSMERALQAVLTKRRKLDIDLRPLTVQDLVVPLAENYSCSAEEYQQFMDFTHKVTGIEDRLKELENPTDDKKKKKR